MTAVVAGRAARERPLPSDSVIVLDPPRSSVSTPSQEVQRVEEEAWVRFALEILSPDTRKLIVLREWDRLSFAEIGAQSGVSEAAARMRYHRALLRLAAVVVRLKSGDVGAALADSDDASAS